MYDFLLLAPHAHASHSLIFYLNQHARMHVAAYTSIFRSLDDVHAYRRSFEAWMPCVGVATKDYDDPKIVDVILGATSRKTLVQVVRDPIECFVSQSRDRQYRATLMPLLGKKFDDFAPEAAIADAIARYITPAHAAGVYQAPSFDRHLVVDVADLKGDTASATVASLWRELCGDDKVESPTFQPIGSREFTLLRTHCRIKAQVLGRTRPFQARLEGDHWVGYFHAALGAFSGAEAHVCTFPNARELMPSLGLTLPIHVFSSVEEWYSIHPSLRKPVAFRLGEAVAAKLRTLDPMHAAAKAAMTFALDDLTPVQSDLLRFGIEDDYATFRKHHPAVAERWTETRKFLGL